MLQSSASNLLNILGSKPVMNETPAQQTSATSSQDTDFNKIYSDVERASQAEWKGCARSGAATDTTQPPGQSVSTGLTDPAAATPETTVDPVEGQTSAVDVMDTGNVLPIQMPIPAQVLLQNSPSDAAMAADGQTLFNTPGGTLPTVAANQLLVSADAAAFTTVQPDSVTQPGFSSAQGSDNRAALLLSQGQSVASDVNSAQITAAGSLLSDTALSDTSVPVPRPELVTGLALAESSAAAGKLSQRPSGLFVPTGLSRAISQGGQAALKSAAVDGVPANLASDPAGLMQVSQDGELPEGLDSQWLERIRQFQQAQQGAANGNPDSGYDNASLMDAYLAGGDMSQQSNALNVENLFQDALGGFDADALSVQDKASAASSGLNGLTGAQLRAADPALKTYTMMVPQPVNDPQWIDSMGEKIVWLTGRNLQSAEIHLNPAELGPVDVKVQVQNDQTTVTFTVQHASVRELLEANVHRLREMMEGNGVNLRDVQVGADTTGQQQAFARNGDEAESGSGHGSSARGGVDDALDGALTEMGTTAISSRNVIDFYA